MPKINTLKAKIITILDTRQGSSAAVKRIRGWHLTQIRARVLLRDEYTCRICGRVSAELVVDHLVPLALGGCEGSDQNLQALCVDCHQKKSDKEAKQRE